MRAEPAALELHGIAKRFDRRWTLRGAELCVEPGEAVAVLGANGSGKTTLLRIVATLTRPTRGSGTVFGHDLLGAGNAVRGLVGLLGHAPGLYPDLSAEENLRFAQRMLGSEGGTAEIDRTLERIGLAAEARERVRFFSAGMQRRVALGRILLSRPRLLLLDEPHAALDADGVRRVHELVAEVREAGGAALVATHDTARAGALFDRIVHLRSGRLEETREPSSDAVGEPVRGVIG